MADSFLLQIVTPLRILLEEQALEVTGPGHLGEFGVMPGHARYLVILKPGVLRYRTSEGWNNVAVNGGFAEVSPEKMAVLAENAEFGSEVDLQKAIAAREEAHAAMKDISMNDDAFGKLEVALLWAAARISAHPDGAGK